MRNRLVIMTIALAAVLIFSLVIVAQNRGGRGSAAPAAPDTRPFNPKELAGIWSRNSQGYGGGGT